MIKEQIADLSKDEILTELAVYPEKFLTAFFKELDIEECNIPHEFYSSDIADNPTLIGLAGGGLTLVEVDSEGGYEGAGEHAEKVYGLVFVDDPDNILIHLQIDGYYNSYDGTEWEDNAYIVYPREVTVTRYFTEK